MTALRCPEYQGVPAGWLWAEALRRLSAAAGPAEPQALALAAPLTGTPAADSDPAAARSRLRHAIVGYLEAVSRRRTAAAGVDDLHRVDGETLALLADVTADLAAARLLVLATYRPAEVSEQISRYLAALSLREPVRVNLAGLDAAGAGTLVPPPTPVRSTGAPTGPSPSAPVSRYAGRLASGTPPRPARPDAQA